MTSSRSDTQRIRDLEREVEWLKGEVALQKAVVRKMRIYDIPPEHVLQADRADAERFRWLVDKYWDVSALEHNQIETGTFAHTFDWEGYSDSASPDIRALIDAAMAKEGV